MVVYVLKCVYWWKGYMCLPGSGRRLNCGGKTTADGVWPAVGKGKGKGHVWDGGTWDS